jgi:hypothetical protein
MNSVSFYADGGKTLLAVVNMNILPRTGEQLTVGMDLYTVDNVCAVFSSKWQFMGWQVILK